MTYLRRMMQFPGQVCSFLRKHRRKFIFAGVLVGGVVGTVKYAQYKVKDWMSQEEKKYLEDLRKQQHFEKTQEHCFAIAEAVVKALKGDIFLLVDTESITNSLKEERDHEKKLELWNELKVAVFTKVSSVIYILTLSAVIIRLQLNHLAAKVYSSSSQTQVPAISDVTQRWFLSLSHEFVAKDGLEYIVGELKQISSNLTKSMPLQCRVQGTDIESVLKSFHDRIKHHNRLRFCKKDSDDERNILDFLIPSGTDIELKSNDDLKLVNEMWDMFDSDDCMKVFESCILKAFQNFCRGVDNGISNTVASGGQIIAIDMLATRKLESDSLPLAKVLPILNSRVDTITSESFLRKILADDMTTKFAANIYESFSSRSA